MIELYYPDVFAADAMAATAYPGSNKDNLLGDGGFVAGGSDELVVKIPHNVKVYGVVMGPECYWGAMPFRVDGGRYRALSIAAGAAVLPAPAENEIRFRPRLMQMLHIPTDHQHEDLLQDRRWSVFHAYLLTRPEELCYDWPKKRSPLSVVVATLAGGSATVLDTNYDQILYLPAHLRRSMRVMVHALTFPGGTASKITFGVAAGLMNMAPPVGYGATPGSFDTETATPIKTWDISADGTGFVFGGTDNEENLPGDLILVAKTDAGTAYVECQVELYGEAGA